MFNNLKKNQKSRFLFKTTLPVFKGWQLIQIYINHCVGQTKHAWNLNRAHRPPVFSLCPRRRTEFQLGWNKYSLGNRAAGILSPHPQLHSAPANQRDGIGTPILGREDLGERAFWWAVRCLQPGHRLG